MDVQTLVVTIVVFGGIAIILPTFLYLFWAPVGPISAAGKRARSWIAIGLGIWLTIALITGYGEGLSFEVFLPFAIIPIVTGLALSFHPAVAEALRRIPAHWIIWLQSYRVLGGVFLFVYYYSGDLTRGFALNAGWGDVLTGVLALPVAWMVMKKLPYHVPALVTWSVIGIGDLILAPASARIYGGAGLVEFPINMIPLFLGPPFGVLMHILTLRIFFMQRQGGMHGAVAA